MLIFREINFEKDLDEIVALIQENLDPEFTSDFFRWKHVLNPAGKSYGILALDEEKIVGLRMFMFWNFQHPEKGTLKAIRPVDTVTDKDYRGKGLFKKLTLEGLQRCENRYDIIFNTPNENSLPGYLKMGWKKFENIKSFKIGFINYFAKSHPVKIYGINELEQIPSEENKINTRSLIDLDFLKWRYGDPVYKLANFSKGRGLIIYKLQAIRGVPAIKIFEIMGTKADYSAMVNSLGKKVKAPVVYYYNSDKLSSLDFIFSVSRNEPVVVYKNDKLDIHNSLDFSMGDLEGIL